MVTVMLQPSLVEKLRIFERPGIVRISSSAGSAIVSATSRGVDSLTPI